MLKYAGDARDEPVVLRRMNRGDVVSYRNSVLGLTVLYTEVGMRSQIESEYKHDARRHYGWINSSSSPEKEDVFREMVAYMATALGVASPYEPNTDDPHTRIGRAEALIEKAGAVLRGEDV